MFFIGLNLKTKESYSQLQRNTLYGTIKNYAKQTLYLYKCLCDTLLLIDTTQTSNNGGFEFNIPSAFAYNNLSSPLGLYKIILPYEQSFQFLYTGDAIEIQTIYKHDFQYNIASDSLNVRQSDENKRFIEFQQLQQQANIANYYLLQMMRLYPIPDPFHKQMETEYYKRFDALMQFVKQQQKDYPECMTTKIAQAYYVPALPDWKKPDSWRDSIIALHFFDYFNPADSFYLHTNILPEKIDWYLALRTNKRDEFGQAVLSEDTLYEAAFEFLEKAKNNQANGNKNFEFVLTYLLKQLHKEKKYRAFLRIYDAYLYRAGENCEVENDNFITYRELAGNIRGVEIGSIAPDFELGNNSGLNLFNIKSDYVLLIFWASWCPHCKSEILNIYSYLSKEFPSLNQNKKTLTTIAISLDTDKNKWQQFIKDYNLSAWINIAELKGWDGNIVKKYNIYATPTLILLDKNKKILFKPTDFKQLKFKLNEI